MSCNEDMVLLQNSNIYLATVKSNIAPAAFGHEYFSMNLINDLS